MAKIAHDFLLIRDNNFLKTIFANAEEINKSFFHNSIEEGKKKGRLITIYLVT